MNSAMASSQLFFIFLSIWLMMAGMIFIVGYFWLKETPKKPPAAPTAVHSEKAREVFDQKNEQAPPLVIMKKAEPEQAPSAEEILKILLQKNIPDHP